MGKLLHRHNNFIVIEEENKRGVVLINTEGKYENYGHLKRLETALMMINLIERRIIPKSNYLRGTAIRVALDERYVQAVKDKIDKDSQKQHFINVNKGVVRKIQSR